MATPRKKPRPRRDYGDGSVYQRASDGLWVGTVELGWSATGARRRARVSAKTEAECRRRLRAKKEQIAQGGASTLSDRTTVKAWAEKWLEQTQRDVRPKTWATNASAVRQWIVPTIGHRRLGMLTAEDVRAVNRAQLDAERAKSTRVRTHAVLVKMLRDAMVEGARIHAGVFEVERAKSKGRPMRAASTRRSMTLPAALRLLELIEGEPDPSRWVAIVLNGTRKGETLGLQWDRCDFERDELRIDRQLLELPYVDNANKHLGFKVPDDYEVEQIEGRFHFAPVKTESGQRIVPMTPWFKAALLRWRDIAPASPHDLVWCRPDGGPLDPVQFLADWRALQQRVGIEHPIRTRKDENGVYMPDQFVVHEARHTTVTLLKELGVADAVIEKIVGQSKLVKDYNHQDLMPEVRTALGRLEQHLALGATPARPV